MFCLQVNVVVFDKIGILIYGFFEVVKIVLFVKLVQCSVEMLLVLIGIVENYSEYFIGVVIINYVKQVRVKIEVRIII